MNMILSILAAIVNFFSGRQRDAHDKDQQRIGGQAQQNVDLKDAVHQQQRMGEIKANSPHDVDQEISKLRNGGL